MISNKIVVRSGYKCGEFTQQTISRFNIPFLTQSSLLLTNRAEWRCGPPGSNIWCILSRAMPREFQLHLMSTLLKKVSDGSAFVVNAGL